MDREEAIKIVQSATVWTDEERKALAMLIPELAESEDERIRKAIEGTIRVYGKTQGEWLCGYDMDTLVVHLREAFGALEKQKENIEREYVFRPLAGTDITIAAEQAIRRVNEGDSLVLAFNGAYIPVRKGCSANEIVDIYDTFIEKQKEQKPEAWDEFDKDCLKRAVWYIENPAPSVVKDTNLAIWLKSLPGRFNFQLKEEWSEEDEKQIAQIERIVKNAGCTKMLQEKIHNWIKSLHTSWKPSEEQMEALKYVTKQWEGDKGVACPSSFKYHAITELYEQLKKLM